MTTTTRERWLEVLVVCCIGVAPDVFFSQLSLVNGAPPVETFHQAVAYVVLRAVWVSIPVLWILRRSGEPWQTFGVVRPRASDIALGVVAFCLYLAASLLALPLVMELAWLQDPEATRPTPGPSTTLDYALVSVLALTNGFAEELVVRAYLITRLDALLGPARAVLLSTALFAAYHTYHGPAVVTLAAGGLVLGVVFLVTRRLWPVAIAHAGLDLYGFVG